MNIESFEYALVTAGVGMGIVFFALITLSVMMLVIRAMFRDRPVVDTAEGGELTGGGADRVEPGPDEVDKSGVPRWALAGAVTYVLQEEQERTPWAAPWTTRPVRR